MSVFALVIKQFAIGCTNMVWGAKTSPIMPMSRTHCSTQQSSSGVCPGTPTLAAFTLMTLARRSLERWNRFVVVFVCVRRVRNGYVKQNDTPSLTWRAIVTHVIVGSVLVWGLHCPRRTQWPQKGVPILSRYTHKIGAHWVQKGVLILYIYNASPVTPLRGWLKRANLTGRLTCVNIYLYNVYSFLP